jgi:hypothetical protein
MKAKTIGILVLSIASSGCVPQARFEWGSYEPALYAYYKNPSEKAEYEKALLKAIAAGEKSSRVAPGLCAELGYIRLENGDTAGARKAFEQEMSLFPESRPFLSGVIQRLSPATSNGGAV